MLMGSSRLARTQVVSQGCGETRPQTQGKGLSSRITSQASWCWPAAIKARKLGMSMPAGQARWQGAGRSLGQTRASGVLVQDVVLEFFPEVMERGENGIDRLPAEVAGPDALQALAGFLQFGDGLHGAGAAGDAGEEIMNLGERLAALGAMAAGLLRIKAIWSRTRDTRSSRSSRASITPIARLPPSSLTVS